MTNRTACLLSVLVGVSLEVLVAAVSGRREAWDSPVYWLVGMPIALLLAGVIGYTARARAWLWTWAIVPAQTATMMLRGGEIGGLFPLAVALSAILSAPMAVVAYLASRFRPAGRRQ